MDQVAWSLGLFSKNHRLEVDLPQNREITALCALTTVGLLYLSCVRICMNRHFLKWYLVEGPGHIWLHTAFECLWPQYMILEMHGTAFGHFLWARMISWSWLLDRNHCILRSLIGQKGWDRPSSLHTRRWSYKGPRNCNEWKSLQGFLHGKLWILVHGLPECLLGSPPRGRLDANSNMPCQRYGLWMRIKAPHNYMIWPLARMWSGPKGGVWWDLGPRNRGLKHSSMDLTFGFKIGPKRENWFPKLGAISSWVGTHETSHESDAMLARHFIFSYFEPGP